MSEFIKLQILDELSCLAGILVVMLSSDGYSKETKQAACLRLHAIWEIRKEFGVTTANEP